MQILQHLLKINEHNDIQIMNETWNFWKNNIVATLGNTCVAKNNICGLLPQIETFSVFINFKFWIWNKLNWNIHLYSMYYIWNLKTYSFEWIWWIKWIT